MSQFVTLMCISRLQDDDEVFLLLRPLVHKRLS